jgi:thioredoxin reductase
MSSARNSYHAIVIGAGHNGLTAATYLAGAGLSTLVPEWSEPRRPASRACIKREHSFPAFESITL